MANTVAYYGTAKITVIKSFIVLALAELAFFAFTLYLQLLKKK